MNYIIKLTCASILILFLITACSTKETDLPPISKEKMQAVLMDMHLAHAAAQFSMVTKDSLLLPHKSNYYDQIFATHQITEAAYQEAYDFYFKHPEMLYEIYDSLIVNLTKIEAENKIEKVEPEAEKVK